MKRMPSVGSIEDNAIGTPFCITIDYTTLDDDTVTLRDRDQMKQKDSFGFS